LIDWLDDWLIDWLVLKDNISNITAISMCWFMNIRFKQWHPNSLNTKTTTTYDVGNPGPGEESTNKFHIFSNNLRILCIYCNVMYEHLLNAQTLEIFIKFSSWVFTAQFMLDQCPFRSSLFTRHRVPGDFIFLTHIYMQ
jgi:hypothetical protein